ncbi:polycystin-1-like protein 2 [Mytilus trossulus]|uniref:polycystin-1-like protein 2 n=1 Tax=Mytilus trossulus TaxID=6551 RepID=UPI00300575B4
MRIAWICFLMSLLCRCTGQNCTVTLMASGVADTIHSICKYLLWEAVNITTSIKSDCSLNNIQYDWTVYLRFYNDQDQHDPAFYSSLLSLESVNKTRPTLFFARHELRKEKKGIYAVNLGVIAYLGSTLIQPKVMTYHLRPSIGCYYEDQDGNNCDWIKDQMKAFGINTSFKDTKHCENVAVRKTSIFDKISGKLLKNSTVMTTHDEFNDFKQSIEDNRQPIDQNRQPIDDNRQDVSDSVPCRCIISPKEGYSLITQFNITCQANTTSLHDTVLYNVYQTLETGKHDMIYLGHSPNMTFLYLHAGHENKNYTYNISISVDKEHGLNIVGKCTDLEVKVFPMSMYTSGDVKNVITDLIGSDVNSNDSVINNLMDNGDYSSAVNILGGVASSLNDNVNKSSGEENKQIREVIVSSLTKVSVTSLDDLDLVAGVLNSATSISDELTDYTQDTALDMYSSLTGVLSDQINSTATNKGEESVGLLLDGLSFMLDTNTNKGSEEMEITTNHSHVDTTKVSKVQKSSKKILTLVDSIADAALAIAKPAAEPLVFVTDNMNIAVMKKSPANTLGQNLANSRSSNIGQFSLPSDSRFSDVLDNLQGDISLQMMLIDKNPYVWDQSSHDVTTPVVSLKMKTSDKKVVTVTDLQEPVEIQISNRAVTETTHFTLEIPLKFVNNTYRVDKISMLKISTNLTKGHSIIMSVRSQQLDFQFRILHQPHGDQTKLNFTSGILLDDGNNFTFISTSASADSLYYTYISPVLHSSSDVSFTQYDLDNNFNTICESGIACEDNTKLLVNLTVESYSVACLYWNEEKEAWKNDGCQVSEQTTPEVIHCQCTHLTSFSGSFLVLPNMVDPFADAALFLTFFDNPIVVCTVIVVWFIFLAGVFWARKADKRDEAQAGIIILSDANPNHSYQYLMCVVTGWWAGAETTAKVSCCVHGNKGHSTKHCLSNSVVGKGCFKAGWEDWFMFTSSHHLGDLDSITIWHDNSGTSPSWFLTRVLVQDLRTNKVYSFILGEWIGVERGSVKVTIPCVKPEDFNTYKNQEFLLKSSRDLRDGHLWLSILSKPCQSHFTRVQRLSCCLSLLLCAMLTSIMFHGVPTDDPDDQVKVASISLSLADIVIGIECGLIMFPINLIIVKLFLRTGLKPKKQRSSRRKYQFDDWFERVEIVEEKQLINDDEDEELIGEEKLQQAQPKMLPWWCLYIAWTIVITVSLINSYFVMLYGLKYGYQKSVEWLVSFFTAFFQSACFQQPIKVFAIAMILTYIFKKPVEIEGLKVDIALRDAVLYEQDKDDETLPQYIVPDPASKKLLQKIMSKLAMEGLIEERLREIILYFLFVTIVLFVIHAHRNVRTSFYCGNALEDIFIRKSWKKDRLSFPDITNLPKFWDYMRVKALPGLDDIENGDKTVETHGDDFFLVGPYRLRQLRVKQNTCPTPEYIRQAFSLTVECSDKYWLGNEDTKHYNQTWNQTVTMAPLTADHWTYQTAWQLRTIPYAGTQATYSGGGYIKEITPSSMSQQTIDKLMTDGWIDGRTSAIFLEFNLYNPNVNMFSVVMFLFEFSANRGIFPYFQIFTTKLYHYGSGTEIAAAVCEVLFAIFTIIFTYYEGKKFKRMGYRYYFTFFWNLIEFITICLCYSVIGLFFQRMVTITWIMDKYKQTNRLEFVSFYAAVWWDFIQLYLMAFLEFLIIVKFLKILSFNQNMQLLSITLNHAKKSLCNFSLLIFVLIFAFAHFCLLAFGNVSPNYKSASSSILTLFNFAIGVSDYYGLQRAHRILGPIFFFLFVLAVIFIYLTVFMSIVNFAITKSKEEKGKKKNELEVVNYLLTKLANILPVELASRMKVKYYEN